MQQYCLFACLQFVILSQIVRRKHKTEEKKMCDSAMEILLHEYELYL